MTDDLTLSEARRRIDHLKVLLAQTLEKFDCSGDWHRSLDYEPWVFEDEDHVGPLRRQQAEEAANPR